MTCKDFNRFGYCEQMESVLKVTFLANRLTDHEYNRLYNIDRFYVDAFFDDCSHIITHFRASEQTTYVLPYLHDLKIAV